MAGILFCLVVIFHLKGHSQSCTPPPECGANPIYFCGEVTDFNWAAIPNGQGEYNIAVFSSAGPSVVVTFYLTDGFSYTGPLNGAGTFQDIPPGCYQIIVCVDGDVDYYCCKTLPCLPQEDGCCELIYPFFTDLPSPVWDFGDGTMSTDQNPVHEYTNINTYPVEGTPDVQIQLSGGGVVHQSLLTFPQGIWAGISCTDIGLSSTLLNSVNPLLRVFPALSYTGRQISIKGSITMNENYQFINCDICMNPSARMVVNAKSLSFLSGTLVHEAECKELAWYGIEIQRGSIIGDDATFTGAYNAIRVPPGLATTSAFSLDNCRFNRNYLGMNLASPVAFVNFSGNTFGLNAGLTPWPEFMSPLCGWEQTIGKPLNPEPFAGIYAETPGGGSLVSVNFPAAAFYPNVFVNLSNGVYLKESNGLIRRSRFENMLTGAYPGDDGVGIGLYCTQTRNLQQWGLGRNHALLSFDNCLHAVKVDLNPQLSGADALVQSYNNRMDVTHAYTLLGGFSTFRDNSILHNNDIDYTGSYGMLVENAAQASRLVIAENRLETTTANATGILLLNFQPIPLGGDYRVSVVDHTGNGNGIFGGADGIAASNFGNALLENNAISGFNRFGVYNLDSPEDDIRCNAINSAAGAAAVRHDMSAGVNIEYNATDNTTNGIDISEACNNTRIRCNTIGSHNTGLFYDAAAVTGEQLPGMLSAGNVWTGSYGAWAAYNGNLFGYSNSLYHYRIGEINITQVFPNLPFPSNWFRATSTGITCDAGCPPPGLAGRAPTSLDSAVAGGTLQPGGLSEHLLKRALYRDLAWYPALRQDNALLNDFYHAYGATAGGKLAAANKALTDGFALSATQQAQRQAAQSDLLDALNQWLALDSLAQEGANPDGQSVQRAALLQTAAVADSVLTALYAENLAARQNAAGALAQTLNGINAGALWEQNEKALAELILATCFVDAAPDAAQREAIRQIAEQCLDSGGPAVARARAWHLVLTGERLEVECNGATERTDDAPAATPTPALSVQVSPNPAQDLLNLKFSEPLPAGCRLEVFDALGRLQHRAAPPEGIRQTSLNIGRLPNGRYYCRLLHDGRIAAVSPFVVLR